LARRGLSEGKLWRWGRREWWLSEGSGRSGPGGIVTADPRSPCGVGLSAGQRGVASLAVLWGKPAAA